MMLVNDFVAFSSLKEYVQQAFAQKPIVSLELILKNMAIAVPWVLSDQAFSQRIVVFACVTWGFYKSY